MDRIARMFRRASRREESEVNTPPAQGEHENEAVLEQQEDREMSLEELLYSTASYHAIVKPVAITMILTALCVIYINTPETRAATEEALSNSYVAFQAPDDASTAVQVGLSLTNALIIVSVICAMTFVIVLLYKYRCLKCLIGYMVFASAALLGFLGGSMFATAIEVYNLAVDQFSYYFTLWNFATVGTGAIFAPWGGFPTWITQGYLIATSVILAWQLSALDPWTSWALLIVLALYDLCAVLTPCGPLKALVNLMSEEGSPDMPGLLYEAELPAEARRPGRSRRSTTATAATNYGSQRSSTSATVETSQSSTVTDNNNGPRQFIATTATHTTATDNSGYSVIADTEQSAAAAEIGVNTTSNVRSALTDATKGEHGEECPDVDNVVGTFVPAIVRSPSSSENSTSNGIEVARTATDDEAPLPPSLTMADPRPGTVAARLAQSRASCDAISDSAQVVTGTEQPRQPRPRALIPFAVAKLYKLQIESEEPERRSDFTPLLEGENLSPNELLARQYTPDQLKSLVVAIFPRNGGRIEPVGRKYMVKDRHGNLKRVLLVDDNGYILEERRRTPEEEREEERNSNTIKLGLGDFIFYSVLVSKAVLYSFTTFVACFLVILAGLGVTLVLLAVYHKALPALPISILLGVVFYLATRGLIEPWFEAILLTPYYV